MHLQRTSGNAAVESLLRARRPPAVQRFGLVDVASAGVGLLEKEIAPAEAPKAVGEKPPGEGEKPPVEDTAEKEITLTPQVKPERALAAAPPPPEAPPPADGAKPAIPQTPKSASAGPEGAHGNGHSPMSVLQSLGGVAPSMLGQALARTGEAANAAQVQEVASLVGSFPSIIQPTGLPAIAERKPAPATQIAEAKVPEARAPAQAQAPDIEAQEKPHVPLSGEADPSLNAAYHADTDHAVTGKHAEAEAAAGADFGEKAIYPAVHPETLHPAHRPDAPAALPAPAPEVPPQIIVGERKHLYQQSQPRLKEQGAHQVAQRREQEATFTKTSHEVKQAGDREIDAETKAASAEQESLRKQAQAGVDAERSQWREENKKVTQAYQQPATSKRSRVGEQISTTVQSADKDAGQKLSEARARADQEKAAADAKAAQAKKDADKPQSWWDKAKGAVSSAFDAVKGAVAGIFDELRKLVKGIIDAAKRAAHAVIDMARTAVVGLIRGFGTILKGLVSVALAAFPSIAAQVRARIDALVDKAVTGVNKAAEALKKRVDAALDMVGKGLDAALRLLQAGFAFILTGLEKLATLPF